jgi:hypothetical protein
MMCLSEVQKKIGDTQIGLVAAWSTQQSVPAEESSSRMHWSECQGTLVRLCIIGVSVKVHWFVYV